ncbi:MAG TPA: potassium-transporting ATPase subunit KdpA [Pirellulales bacterium]|nr:potassium-transporting ATPase subunit KdpA [Pirellulales bacterium]
MWALPVLFIGTMIVLSIPLGVFMARALDGRWRAPAVLRSVEQRIDTGPQDWKQYALAMLAWNTLTFVVGFAILTLQPYLPLNPDHKGMLSPTTVFNTLCSFLSNTNLQHYSGEVHLSYFSQLFVICWKQFHSPAIGLAVLVAMTRGLRGDTSMGNFYVDLWRSTVYVMLPLAAIVGVLLMFTGMPMTLAGNAQATTVEPGAMGTAADGAPNPQSIARGPVAAIVAIKQLGTNGGGFFGPNSTHPFENPTDWSNYLENVCILLVPMAVVVMFGVMLGNVRHAAVIFGVMLAFLAMFTGWAIYTDSTKPNPGIVAQQAVDYKIIDPTADGGSRDIAVPALAGLPVDQKLGNLEGKELRFGTSAGPTWAACTTCTSNGSVNSMHDSLNPLAGLAPLAGMWLNCNFGGIGVGLINFLIYLIVGVFLAGLMVGRTPEYLGKKVESREMKLAMLALLIHPLMILGPAGLFSALDWGMKAENNPGAHGFAEILYEFTSASANNGSGFEGLGDTYGFADNPTPAPYSPHWDIACGLVMLISRFVPIIAPLAIAGSLAAKKRTPMTAGTLRTDSLTFGCVLFGTIVLLGALLFLPSAVLGPVAEHLGPMPFGR